MAIKAKPIFSLKDDLFNATPVGKLADQVAAASARFDRETFFNTAMSSLLSLALKARITMRADLLNEHLPGPYRTQLSTLTRALPPTLDSALSDDDFGEFIWAVPSEFVGLHGCAEARVDASPVRGSGRYFLGHHVHRCLVPSSSMCSSDFKPTQPATSRAQWRTALMTWRRATQIW